MAMHRKPKEKRALLAGAAGVSTVAVALTVGSGSPASAASTSTWDRVAACESSGQWNRTFSTGVPLGGGLQIKDATWAAYGGLTYAAHPYLATRAQQIAVAERVLAGQGARAWVCAPQAGLTTSQSAPRPLHRAAPHTSRQAPRAALPSSRAARAVAYAISRISSAPYLYGGNGPVRLDCSGLTSQAWLHAGVRIPRTAAGQLRGLHRVPLSSIRPGDLVIYTFRSYADHVALYVGSGRTVDTASSHVNSGVGYSHLHRLGGTIAGVVRPYGSTASVPRPPAVHVESAPAPAGTYRVVRGDWLSKIARAHKTTWQVIYNLNRDRIKNPDLIYPGQLLRMPEGATSA